MSAPACRSSRPCACGCRPTETLAVVVDRIGRLPLVERAEPNYRLHGAAIPNDPVFSAQSAYLALIEAPAAWDIEAGDAAVLVAVLDSGIDLAHPDLEGKVWTNALEMDNGLDDDRNGCIDDRHGCSFLTSGPENEACGERPAAVVDDDGGHGTFTAGIIAASANNAIGMTGAAPGVTIVPVKILDCLGAGTAADAAEGLLCAARVGARVANISFSADGDSFTLASAIREVYERQGMVIVAATGNEGASRVNFPARLAETIAVASSGTTADAAGRSPFSNWGAGGYGRGAGPEHHRPRAGGILRPGLALPAGPALRRRQRHLFRGTPGDLSRRPPRLP